MSNIKITDGGYKVTEFRKLKNPVDRGVLTPLIYRGNVKTNDLGTIEVSWDKDGKCSNLLRDDCFVNVS